jgi:hypothetical protein
VPVRLHVPAGAASADTVVRFRMRPRTVARKPTYASRLGPGIEIVPSHPIASGQIRIKFDPAKALPPGRGTRHGPTVRNVFIAVLDERLDVLVPLRTRYDASTGELVAHAPHFSWFQTLFVRPGKHVLHAAGHAVSVTFDAATDGVGAASDYVTEIAKAILDEGASSLFARPKEPIACDHPSLSYEATADDATQGDKFRACAVQSGDGPGAKHFLRVQNDFAYPSILLPPKGVRPSFFAYGDDASDLFPKLIRLAWLLGGRAVLPGPGRSQLEIASSAPAQFKVDAKFDPASVVIDLVVAYYSGLWGAEKDELGVFVRRLEAAIEARLKTENVDLLARASFVAEVRTVAREYKQHPESAERTLAIVDAFGCALAGGNAAAAGIDAIRSSTGFAKVAESLAKAAYGCVSSGLHATAGSFKDVLVGLAGTLRVLPEYVDALLSGAFAVTSGGEFNPYVATIRLAPPRVYIDIHSPEWIEPELVAEPEAMVERDLQLGDIRWQDWGKPIATAKATAVFNICKPDCGSSHFVTGPARLRAFDLHREAGHLIYGCMEIMIGPSRPLNTESAKFATPADLEPMGPTHIGWVSGLLRKSEAGPRDTRDCPDSPPGSG